MHLSTKKYDLARLVLLEKEEEKMKNSAAILSLFLILMALGMIGCTTAEADKVKKTDSKTLNTGNKTRIQKIPYLLPIPQNAILTAYLYSPVRDGLSFLNPITIN